MVKNTSNKFISRQNRLYVVYMVEAKIASLSKAVKSFWMFGISSVAVRYAFYYLHNII